MRPGDSRVLTVGSVVGAEGDGDSGHQLYAFRFRRLLDLNRRGVSYLLPRAPSPSIDEEEEQHKKCSEAGVFEKPQCRGSFLLCCDICQSTNSRPN